MKTFNETSGLISHFRVLGSFNAQKLPLRPTLQNVISRQLNEALGQKYASLKLNVANLSIAEPLPVPENQTLPGTGTAQRYRLMSVLDVVLQSFLDQNPVTLTQGVHRLTEESKVLDPYPLAVNMGDLQAVINESAPLLIEIWQDALTQFWSVKNGVELSPFQWLRTVLPSCLTASVEHDNPVPALSNDQKVALLVADIYPDKEDREKGTAETPQHIYLVNIEYQHAEATQRIQLPGEMVVTRQMRNQLLVMTYSLAGGIKVFDSLSDYGTSLATRLRDSHGLSAFTWALYEPQGHFFTALAFTLLDQQLRDVFDQGQTARAERWSAGRLAQALDNAASMFPFFSRQDRPWLNHVMSKTPDWLQQASPAHLLAYSKLLIAQTIFQKQSQSETFLAGIDALPVYAEQLIRQRLEIDHPDSGVDISQIEIHDVGVEVLNISIFSDTVMSLTEFVLSYRGGWPVALIDVKHRLGLTLPTWFNANYAQQLVNDLDVGTQYIELIKRLLVDEAEEVSRRKKLFKSQVSIQLPMFALEMLIKGDSGFTEPGWKVVNRLMRPDGNETLGNGEFCIRPLGFVPYEGADADYVSNMFVLGARDIKKGPFILYQPFSTEPLVEYESWTGLFSAIRYVEDLNYRVLQWMDDNARGLYADGGFARPHLESALLEGELALLPRSPAVLSTQSIVGDYFNVLFADNAAALMKLADKQTVTVAERRWLLVKKAGWALFNGLTFFVSGPLQKAAWLFQTLLGIDGALQARINGDKQAAMQSVIDLLLNVGMALLQEGLSFRAQANERMRLSAPVDEPLFSKFDEQAISTPPLISVPAATQQKKPDLEVSAVGDYSALNVTWFDPPFRLTKAQQLSLATFEVSTDLSQATPIEVGELTGVLKDEGKSYVKINSKYYSVERDTDGLRIQDANQPTRWGPWLMKDAAGKWQLDLRLRLKGGAPKSRIKKLLADKEQKKNELQAQTEVLDALISENERVLGVTEKLMDSAPARRKEFIDRYKLEFESCRLKAHDAITLLIKAERLVPSEPRRSEIQERWARLVLQHFKLQNYLEEERNSLSVYNSQLDFLDKLKEIVSELKEGSSTAYDTWVDNLKKAQEVEAELFYNATLESEALSNVDKQLLSRDSPLWDVKHLEAPDYFDRHWSPVYLETLCELVIDRSAINLSPEEQNAFDIFGQATLVDTAWSQINVKVDNQLYTREHIELFDRAIEQYSRAESVCNSLINLESPNFRNEYLAPIIQVVRHLREFAEAQLEGVIRDSESSSSDYETPRPGPSRRMTPAKNRTPSTGSRPQQVIKTTTNQVLVGELRSSTSESENEIVDVTESFGRMSVRSFKKVKSGAWEEITSLRPAVLHVNEVKSLPKLEADGKALLAKADSAIDSARISAQTSRIPVEIEEILEFKSKNMEDVATQIDQILAKPSPQLPPLTDARKSAVTELSKKLKAAAVRVRTAGKELRISTIKRLPPTGPHIEYLNAQGEITIKRSGKRKHLSKGQRKDFLQEYLISDKDGSELWYAHFHYASMDTPAASFDAAHLKTAEQRTLSEQALYSRAQTSGAVIGIYRSKLAPDLAQRLFLSIP